MTVERAGETKKKENIKLIAIDMDGTLLNSKKEIDAFTHDQLIRIQKQGIKVALASGRLVKALIEYAKDLKLDEFGGYIISNNGGLAHLVSDMSVVYDNPLTIEQAQRVLNHLKNFDVIPMVEDGDYLVVDNVYNNMVSGGGQTYNVMIYEAHTNGFLLRESRDLAQEVHEPPAKILNAGNEDYLKAHYKEMAAPFEGELDSMFTGATYYEFTAKNTNKGSAIASLPFKKEEIVAIGDAQNDLPMFEQAGIRLAMSNAVDELKEKADEIIGDNDSQSIGRWIEANL